MEDYVHVTMTHHLLVLSSCTHIPLPFCSSLPSYTSLTHRLLVLSLLPYILPSFHYPSLLFTPFIYFTHTSLISTLIYMIYPLSSAHSFPSYTPPTHHLLVPFSMHYIPLSSNVVPDTYHLLLNGPSTKFVM